MDRQIRSDKYLISEQPGMKILITGLVLAFFMGYTLKSYLNPARVASQIEKAASHIHKDVRVTFEKAQVSLSDGILPRFAVVINNVRMESNQACWFSPVLEVDEIRLPLSLWGLITRTAPIKNIEADIVKLTLRGTSEECEKEKRTVKEQKNSEHNTGPLVELSPSEQAEKYRNAVSGISIGKFKIALAQYPQYPSEFLSFVAKVKSFEPKVIEVTAKTNLMRDEQVGDYLSHANLFLQYKDSPEETVQAHFFGNFREGHYSMIANYTLEDRLLNVETDLKHIPLSQILSLMQKYGLASNNLNGKQVWVSAKARMTGDGEKLQQAPLEVNDFLVEGDLGEMFVDQASFSSLAPLKYKPILIDVRKMRVDKLLSLLNRSQKHRIFGDLGVFTGQAEIVSERSIRLSGEHAGLQFIFSNKGQRELQIIDRMSGDFSLLGDSWNFRINRVEPQGGVFIGNVKLKADRDFKEVEVKASVDEMQLAPAVQKLMTQGGEIGVLSVNADAKFQEGHLSILKGLAQLNKLNVEGMTFGKTKGRIDYVKNEVVFDTQVQSLSVEKSSPAQEVLSKVTAPRWWLSEKLDLKDIRGQFHWKGSQSLQWKNFDAHVGKDGKLHAEGGWNDSGELSGSVMLKDGKSVKKFVMGGNRENPEFEEDTPNPARGMRK